MDRKLLHKIIFFVILASVIAAFQIYVIQISGKYLAFKDLTDRCTGDSREYNSSKDFSTLKADIQRLENKFHKEKETEFLSRNKELYVTGSQVKELSLNYREAKPSGYDFSNRYEYVLSACYYDTSTTRDCVGPEVTNTGVFLEQDETINSVKIQENYFEILNNNPVYLVTIRTDKNTKYALFYPTDITEEGLSWYSFLSNYGVINSEPSRNETFLLSEQKSGSYILGSVVRDEDVPNVKYNLMVNIISAKVSLETVRAED